MLDMGFAEDLEAILDETPGDAADRAVLGHHAAPARLAGPPAPERPGADHASAGRRPSRARRRGSARPPTSSRGPPSPPRSAGSSTSRRPTAAIVFCRTREEVDSLTETLNGRGYRAEALHGGMSQEQRDRVMGRLRGGTADLLVATDVAARGLDIEQLTHVVNYDVPSAPESYVHRIGRVGPGRPRGRGDHAGRAARAPDAQDHRAGRRGADRRRRRCRPSPTCAPAGWTSPGPRCARACSSDDLDRFRVVVETLTDEFDLMEVALAAVKLAHEAGGAVDDDEEIPQVGFRPDKDRARPAAAAAGRRRAARPRRPPAARPRGCSSAPAATPGSARATWSARSPARPG